MAAALGPDDQTMLMLCSQLGLADAAEAAALRPYTLGEWNRLARLLRDSALQRPGNLLGRAAGDIASSLGLSPAEAERLARLLERGGLLAIELERLASRGIWAITRASDEYPSRLRQKLREAAPPVLFGAGDLALCAQPALAIVGSRNVDPAGAAFAGSVSRQAARGHLAIVSGAARGADSIAMVTALAAGGSVIGVPADSLEGQVRSSSIRTGIAEGCLVLLTPYHPKAPFSIGTAMGRNKIIYGLADWGLVVAADKGQGGTWAGATEALKAGWGPVFVRITPDAPAGNRALLDLGALPFPSAEGEEELGPLLATVAADASARPTPAAARDQDGSEGGSAKAGGRRRGRPPVAAQGELPLFPSERPTPEDDSKPL